MSLKNLIVQGKFVTWLEDTPHTPDQLAKKLAGVQSTIIHYLISLGFGQIFPPSMQYRFQNLEFTRLIIPQPVIRPKKLLFSSKKVDENELYFEKLRELKISSPYRISVSTYPGFLKNRDVIFVEIISEPAIVQQYQQLHIRPSLNEDDIDLIKYENEQLIERLGKANLLEVLEKPTPLASFYKTDISEKLKIYGFSEISKFLEDGREDIEMGRTEDGLVDLRTALERFFVIVVESKGQKSAPQKKVDQNIDKLRGFGYIDEYTHQLLLKLSYNGLYITLSNVTHDRISRDYFDSRFQFNIAEQIFDYILERVIRLNLSGTPKKIE